MQCVKMVAAVMSVIGLCACDPLNFTMVQYKYEQKRDDCRELAEMKYDLYKSGGGAQLNARDVNSGLTTLYNDCMFSQGWTIGNPPKDGSEVTKTPRLRQNVN